MDDIVAVKVRDAKSVAHFFITWGRIFDRIDSKSLEEVIAKHAETFGIRTLKSVSVCDSLQEASHTCYFYEGFFHFSQEKIPFGEKSYVAWRAKMKREMMAGRKIYYCGASKKKSKLTSDVGDNFEDKA